jgi:hypothetical protein
MVFQQKMTRKSWKRLAADYIASLAKATPSLLSLNH